MPIYEYQCQSCGHLHEALQKISDAPLVDCPADFKTSGKKNLAAGGGDGGAAPAASADSGSPKASEAKPAS